MDEILKIAAQFGLPGLMLLAMSWYIVHLHQIHSVREDKLITIISSNTAAYGDLKGTIGELKTLIEYIKEDHNDRSHPA